MNYIIEGEGDLVNPDEKHQYRNKGDKPFKIICGVPKEFESYSLWTFNFFVGCRRSLSEVKL